MQTLREGPPVMGEIRQPWVVFRVDECRYALPLNVVERIEWAAAPLPLPGAPAGIAGLLDVHGRILPLAEARSALRLPPRPMTPADQMLLVADAVPFLLLVDSVEGVLEVDPARIAPLEHSASDGGVRGAVGVLDDAAAGMVMLCEAGAFVRPDVFAVLADLSPGVAEKRGEAGA